MKVSELKVGDIVRVKAPSPDGRPYLAELTEDLTALRGAPTWAAVVRGEELEGRDDGYCEFPPSEVTEVIAVPR